MYTPGVQMVTLSLVFTSLPVSDTMMLAQPAACWEERARCGLDTQENIPGLAKTLQLTRQQKPRGRQHQRTEVTPNTTGLERTREP